MTDSAPSPQHFAMLSRQSLPSLRALGASPAVLLTYVAIRAFIRRQGQAWKVRLATLCHQAGVSLSSVRRSIAWMRTAGLLAVRGTMREDMGRGANVYELLWWPEDHADPKASPSTSPKPTKATQPPAAAPVAALTEQLVSNGWTAQTAAEVLDFVRKGRPQLRKQIRTLRSYGLWPAGSTPPILLEALEAMAEGAMEPQLDLLP